MVEWWTNSAAILVFKNSSKSGTKIGSCIFLQCCLGILKALTCIIQDPKKLYEYEIEKYWTRKQSILHCIVSFLDWCLLCHIGIGSNAWMSHNIYIGRHIHNMHSSRTCRSRSFGCACWSWWLTHFAGIPRSDEFSPGACSQSSSHLTAGTKLSSLGITQHSQL